MHSVGKLEFDKILDFHEWHSMKDMNGAWGLRQVTGAEFQTKPGREVKTRKATVITPIWKRTI